MFEFVRGDALPEHLQAEAKRRYVHRYTGDHTPGWASHPRPNGDAYMVQFKDDADWLAHSEFPLTKAGNIAHWPCRSQPTWPNGQEA